MTREISTGAAGQGEVSEVSGTTAFGYNEHGELETRTDARGVTLPALLRKAVNKALRKSHGGGTITTLKCPGPQQ